MGTGRAVHRARRDPSSLTAKPGQLGACGGTRVSRCGREPLPTILGGPTSPAQLPPPPAASWRGWEGRGPKGRYSLNRPSQSQRDRSNDRAGLSFISHPPSHAASAGSRPSRSVPSKRPGPWLARARERPGEPAGGGRGGLKHQRPEAKAPGGAPGQAQRGGGRAGGSGALTCVLGVSTRWWKSPTFPGLSCGAGQRGERPEPLADGHLASPAF